MKEEVIFIDKISKEYGHLDNSVKAVDEISLKIMRGEFTALVGPSGSGKTTLLNLMSGLDTPTSGKTYLAGKSISDMHGNDLSDYRRDHIGFIFQSYNLIPVLTAYENIEYILLLQGVPLEERRERVFSILKEVGLEGREHRKPTELSGGQQQRVAVARAMVSKPDIILADEPTANLDSHTGSALLDMMKELNEKKKITFVFSTHDQMIMDRAKRLVILKDGKLFKDEVRS
jgi:putative ABC transport system ATP-binding protein